MQDIVLQHKHKQEN